MKIRPVGAELFHADRHEEANNRFSKLRKRPTKTLELLLLLVIPSCMCHDTSTQPEYSQYHPTIIIAHI